MIETLQELDVDSPDTKAEEADTQAPMTTEGSTSHLLSRPRPDTTALQSRWDVTAADQRLVAETLAWFAGLFGTARARFVRNLEYHGWVVQTLVQGKIVMQAADHAEIAMAWSIALSGGPARMTRPRVAPLDGSSIRPIAVTNYVAAPVICQQRIIGIVEAAGDIRSDAERYLARAEGRLSEFGRQLLFDPQLAHEPIVTDDTAIDLACCAFDTPIRLTSEEWELAAALDGPTSIESLAEKCGMDLPQTVDVARGLLRRGLVAALN